LSLPKFLRKKYVHGVSGSIAVSKTEGRGSNPLGRANYFDMKNLTLGQKYDLDVGGSAPISIKALENNESEKGIICQYLNSTPGRKETIPYEIFQQNGFNPYMDNRISDLRERIIEAVQDSTDTGTGEVSLFILSDLLDIVLSDFFGEHGL